MVTGTPAVECDAFPVVDYASHPAYAGVGTCAWDESRIAGQVQEIDRAFVNLLERKPPPEKVEALFDAEVGKPIDALLALLVEANTLSGHIAEYTARSVSAARRALLSQARYIARKPNGSARPPLSSKQLSQLATLNQAGVSVLDPRPDCAVAIWRKTWWERARLRRYASRVAWSRCALSLDPDSPAGESVQQILRESGAFAIAATYLGCEVELCYAALDYSHERQSWYRDCYADAGVRSASTVYMHLDADFDIVKAMLYLSDVSVDNGAFCFVHGSHRWPRSDFLMALYKGFDQEQAAFFQPTANRLDYEGGYYRPRFKHPDFREGLMRLPPLLRGSTHFGDDVIDESDLSRRLLSAERAYTGPAGTLVMFHGSRGIHRGSLVRHGERWAVQIAVRGISSASSRGNGTRLSRATRRLRYQAHRAKRILAGDL